MPRTKEDFTVITDEGCGSCGRNERSAWLVSVFAVPNPDGNGLDVVPNKDRPPGLAVTDFPAPGCAGNKPDCVDGGPNKERPPGLAVTSNPPPADNEEATEGWPNENVVTGLAAAV